MAKELRAEGQLPSPTVSTLAKSALITMFNMKLKIDAENERIKKAKLEKNSATVVSPNRSTNSELEELEKQLAIVNTQIPTYEEFMKLKNKQNQVLTSS
jgi:hypothetical protein